MTGVSWGGTFGNVLAMNSTGQITGSSSLPFDNGEHAFVWDGTLFQNSAISAALLALALTSTIVVTS